MSVGITAHRISPNNIIARLVKHVDKRPRGRDDKGRFINSPHFTNKYDHPISSHIRDWSKSIGGGGVGRSIWKCS